MRVKSSKWVTSSSKNTTPYDKNIWNAFTTNGNNPSSLALIFVPLLILHIYHKSNFDDMVVKSDIEPRKTLGSKNQHNPPK